MTPIGKALRTSTFRLSLIYLALFGISVLSILALIYWTTAGFMERQTDETIAAEITGLHEQYRRFGVPGLSQVVAERSKNQRSSLYLLIGPGPVKFSGNLDAFPNATSDDAGWMDFQYERTGGGDSAVHAARARILRVANTFTLLVGRDVQERRDIIALIENALAWAAALMLALGIGGGLLMSRNLLRRVDSVAVAAEAVMAGDLARRLPVRGSGDELDRLSETLNAMLDQLETLMQAMRQVTDNIAHDLRTPLNRMQSRLELALLDAKKGTDQTETIEATIADAQELLNVFNALLRIARIESGARRSEFRRVDLDALCQDVAELYEPLAEEKNITLTLKTGSGGSVIGDGQLLSQALANLIDNAIKYTPDGGRIVLEATNGEDGARLAVIDNGPGIPANAREHVTNRFVRLDRSRGQPGSGLGLSLVRAVAGLHGGELVLKDASPGLSASLSFPT